MVSPIEGLSLRMPVPDKTIEVLPGVQWLCGFLAVSAKSATVSYPSRPNELRPRVDRART